MVATLVTDEQGVCTWTFPEPLQATPHVVATAVAFGPVVVTARAVDETGAMLTAWHLDGVPAVDVDVTVVALPLPVAL